MNTAICIMVLLLSSQNIHASTLLHTKSNDPKEVLVLEILKLALSKNEQNKSYQYEPYSSFLTEARLFQMVKDRTLSVMWAGTQEKYEQELLPIRIPVLKGLLGHRIFIIRSDDQSRFDNIERFEQLQNIPLGQGRFWGDTAILQHNNLNTITPVKYESLFHMLEGSRFDYFPRAVHEPFSEVELRKELNLAVEKNILLVYPFAMYFFVNRSDIELANDIDTGFRAAIADGSYNALFFNHPMIKEAIDKSNLKSRTVFRLNNPNLSPETPLEDETMWLKLEEL